MQAKAKNSYAIITLLWAKIFRFLPVIGVFCLIFSNSAIYADPIQKFKIATDYFNNEKYSEAIIELKSYIILYPDGESMQNVFLMLSDIYVKQNDYSKAIVYLKKLTDKFPKEDISCEATLKIAFFYQKLGKYEKALQIYELVIDNYPDTEYSDEAQSQIDLIDDNSADIPQ